MIQTPISRNPSSTRFDYSRSVRGYPHCGRRREPTRGDDNDRPTPGAGWHLRATVLTASLGRSCRERDVGEISQPANVTTHDPRPHPTHRQTRRPANFSVKCPVGQSSTRTPHINPHRPAARHFDEILGYHYYTELAHSTGMPAELVAAELDPDVRAQNLAKYLDRIDSTVQYSWLLEIARTFHQFPHDRMTPANIGALIDRGRHERDGAAWDQEVWKTSKLEAVFLTNEFDDPLDGWDTAAYVPCLRTDDLVLKLHDPTTIGRLRHGLEHRRSRHGELAGRDRRGFRAIRQAGSESLRDQLAPRFRAAPRNAPAGRHADPQSHSRNGSPPRRAR